MHSGDFFFLQINHVDATLLLNILRQTRWTYVSENEKRSNDKQSIFHWKTYTKTALLIKYWLELYIFFYRLPFHSRNIYLFLFTGLSRFPSESIFVPFLPLSRHLPSTSVNLLSIFLVSSLFPPLSHSSSSPLSLCSSLSQMQTNIEAYDFVFYWFQKMKFLSSCSALLYFLRNNSYIFIIIHFLWACLYRTRMIMALQDFLCFYSS